MSRDWGPWTQIKLDALENYMSAFTVASQKAKRTLYLDLFGGRPDNLARGRDAAEEDEVAVFAGSALRAAEVSPPFTKLLVTELNRSAADQQRARLHGVAGQRAVVIQGDCNVAMPEALDRLVAEDQDWRWAATFALIDQYSAQVTWETLDRLAKFKHPKAKTKAELCLYFGPSFILRGLSGPGGAPNTKFATRLDAMFGGTLWRHIVAARDDGALSWEETEFELVNTMRWLLEDQLGYGSTMPLQLKNRRGRHLFSLIFATDHAVGEKIMGSVFDVAGDAIDDMVKFEKLHAKINRQSEAGQGSLLGAADLIGSGDQLHRRPTLAPPTEPFTYTRLWNLDW